MMKYRIIWICCLFCTTLFAQQKKNFFVAPLGNDTNTGLSANFPLQSINTAIRMAKPGDTVFLLPGVYREKIQFTRTKGLPDSCIYLYGYLPAHGSEKPVIDGGAPVPGMDLSNNWIELTGAAWIEIGNLCFRNGWTDPVRVDKSSFISFKNCDFTGGRKLILATGSKTHHLLVENCSWDQGGERLWTIEKDSLGVDAWLSMHHLLMGYYNGSLVDSRATGGSFVIRGNHISYAYNGIRFTSKKGYDANVEIYNNTLVNIRDNDFEPEHYAYNMHIYHNRSHNIHKTFSVDDVAGGYIYYYGNTVTNDSTEWAKKICSGFWKVYGGTDSLSYPLYAFNNSFFGYGKAFNAMEKNARQLKHFNNAYFFGGADAWVLQYIDPTNEFDYDLSNKPWSATMVGNHFEQHGKIADPQFADPLHGNLLPAANSPVIDAGKIMVLKEFGWTQSFHGSAPDIGAYENGELADGPAFRFRIPENPKAAYIETPRIVKYKTAGHQLHIYFSDAMDPSTVSTETVLVMLNGKRAPVNKTGFSDDNYELVIDTKAFPAQAQIAISFLKMPRSISGQKLSYWASAIPVINQ